MIAETKDSGTFSRQGNELKNSNPDMEFMRHQDSREV